MTGSCHVSQQRRPAVRRAGTLAVALGLVVALAGAPSLGRADYFPTDPPVQFFGENFEDQDLFIANWTPELVPGGSYGLNFDNFSPTVTCAGPSPDGHWGSQSIQLTSPAVRSVPLVALLVDSSLPENLPPGPPPPFSALDWTSFRVEYDFFAGTTDSVVGFEWAGTAPVAGVRQNYYYVYVDQIPTATDAAGGARARWNLHKVTAGSDMEIAHDDINLGAVELTIQTQQCYRLRLQWFCGNLQVSVRRFDYSGTCSAGCAYGCDVTPGSCTPTGDPDGCWCTFLSWNDSAPLGPGATGILIGTLGSGDLSTYVDNFSAAAWGTSCSQVCDPWSDWSEDWARPFDSHAEARDRIRFKLLYEAGLVDQRQGTNNLGRVDANVVAPGDGDPSHFCDGWRQLVDLPDPLAPPGSTMATVRAFLEPIATAVSYEFNVTTGTYGFVNTFDNDPNSPTFNPIPLVATGNTPIAAALMDAYHWYQTLRSPSGTWATDRLAGCRKWYVVLITDGFEHCARHPDGSYWDDYACEPGQAGAPASANNDFAAPLDTSGTNALDPVRVDVIGFGGGVTGGAVPLIKCVADNTGGEYYPASNAGELATSLYHVFTNMVSENRSFVPVAVSPSSAQTTAGAAGDFLVLVPRFIPWNDKTIWQGDMLSFPVNPAHPVLPMTTDTHGNVILDIDQATWSAARAIEDQLTGGTPTRWVYWPYNDGSGWQRVLLDDVKTNATYKAAFKAQLLQPAVTDAQVDHIVDFILYKDPSARPVPPPPQQLGDIFHSLPVISSPPNNFTYFFNDLHATDTPALPYSGFLSDNQHRRRVALVGANDGMLHAFDVGYYNRDTTNYPNAFDLPGNRTVPTPYVVPGSGAELFAVVPDGVMPKVYRMVTGTEEQYMVDGNTTLADVFMPRPGGSTDEWRTIAVASLREGGRSYLALDVTHPDPPNTDWDVSLQYAACQDNGATGCTGNYPSVVWEFTDTADDNGNGQPDMGATWSPPAIARVKKEPASGTTPDELWVAFFGGGWDESETNITGTYFYGVDVKTGAIIYKQYIGASLPGAATALDENNDGWVDTVYFGTTAGDIYRLDVTALAQISGTPGRVTNWTLFKIYDFADNLQFFTRPVVVPAVFNGSSYIWGLALGSGDRPNAAGSHAMDGIQNRFYFVLDTYNQETTHVTRTEADLVQVNPADPLATGSYLDPPTHYGWFILLGANEKVNADAIVAAEEVIFPTFLPTESSDPNDPNGPTCMAGGTGLLYQVYYNNANPVNPTEGRSENLNMGMIVGTTAYTVGDKTEVSAMGWQGVPQNIELLPNREHVVTNWRQD